MAQQCNSKSSALGKDQVLLLLDLISTQKSITTKATNATSNKMKEDAWKCIAESFNAATGDFRRPEQLRLKWENLKKACRKRNALIRQNNIKTGGGKMYIPPDEALDRVASFLGSTCTGFSVEFGGDAMQEPVAVEMQDFGPLLEQPSIEKSSGVLVMDINDLSCGVGTTGEGSYTPKKFIFNTPKKILNRKKKLMEEVLEAKKEKNLAMAAYFNKKVEKIRLENEKLKLEIENLRAT